MTLDEVAGRPGAAAMVLGAGASGVAACRVLRAHGWRVALADEAPAEKTAAAAERLAALGVEVRGGVPPDGLPEGDFALCVASPSISCDHPWVRQARARGMRVVGEQELAFAVWPGRILAVTGSKGKSSLVKLCAEALAGAGISAEPAGNYGTPLCELAMDRPDPAWAVDEVSSFQLELVEDFRPRVAVLLNLQPDHLDRHGTMDAYRGLKMRLFRCMGEGDTALLPEGFAVAPGEIPGGVRVWRFGTGAEAQWRYVEGRGGEGGRIDGVATDGAPVRVACGGSWFDNPVLGLAAAAGAGALCACGLSAEGIAAGLRAFVPLPHRTQPVAEHEGVRYVDDSKATSLAATEAALRMVAGPIRLIAGGRLKESVLDGLKELLTNRVKKVYLIGESSGTIREAWSPFVECAECGTMGAAVDRAMREAAAGETVLLSPGCASFDQFTSYKARGDAFAEEVRARLPQG
ncbi:MAG: UDP-N-acetylmuramoyl-L-alanine--D-glutamate ligase [Kiritimatiellia bacterium]